jgi:hypothetical protein
VQEVTLLALLAGYRDPPRVDDLEEVLIMSSRICWAALGAMVRIIVVSRSRSAAPAPVALDGGADLAGAVLSRMLA